MSHFLALNELMNVDLIFTVQNEVFLSDVAYETFFEFLNTV